MELNKFIDFDAMFTSLFETAISVDEMFLDRRQIEIRGSIQSFVSGEKKNMILDEEECDLRPHEIWFSYGKTHQTANESDPHNESEDYLIGYNWNDEVFFHFSHEQG